MTWKIAESLSEAIGRNFPLVIIQGKSGYSCYATIMENVNILSGQTEILAFPLGDTDFTELQFKPCEYGETWRCIVPEDDPYSFEINMKFPF